MMIKPWKSRKNYLTPTNYLELIMTFKGLLQKKKTEVVSLKARYIGGLGMFSNSCLTSHFSHNLLLFRAF